MTNKTQNTYIDKLINKTQIPREIFDIDVNDEWQRFKQKVNSTKVQHFQPRPAKARIYYITAIAASIIIIFGIYLNFFAYTTYKTSSVQKITLADNSIIILSKNSTLKTSKLYGLFNRKVKLNGTAFFEISHNNLKPFIVRTNNFSVKVLGTKFLVSTNKQQISVTQGLVQVKTFKHKTLLTKGQQAKIFKNQIITKSIEQEKPVLQTGKIHFDSTNLETVAQNLSLIYAYPIHVATDIKNFRLTATFENQQLDSVLNIIARTLDIKVIKKNGAYWLVKN